MMLEYVLSGLLALAVSGVFSYLLTGTVRHRLYSLEVDLADLQDRHLRQVRREAAKNRWNSEDELDDKLAELSQPTPPKAVKKVKSWASKLASSSGESQAG